MLSLLLLGLNCLLLAGISSSIRFDIDCGRRGLSTQGIWWTSIGGVPFALELRLVSLRGLSSYFGHLFFLAEWQRHDRARGVKVVANSAAIGSFGSDSILRTLVAFIFFFLNRELVHANGTITLGGMARARGERLLLHCGSRAEGRVVIGLACILPVAAAVVIVVIANLLGEFRAVAPTGTPCMAPISAFGAHSVLLVQSSAAPPLEQALFDWDVIACPAGLLVSP